jgi:hypothetical protein
VLLSGFAGRVVVGVALRKSRPALELTPRQGFRFQAARVSIQFAMRSRSSLAICRREIAKALGLIVITFAISSPSITTVTGLSGRYRATRGPLRLLKSFITATSLSTLYAFSNGLTFGELSGTRREE